MSGGRSDGGGRAAAAAPLLEASGLALGYGAHVVLQGVDLTLHAGELWFVLGPNGEGKSTLLRAILGQLEARQGVLRLRSDLRDRARIGFVPQSCHLNPALPTSVREFVLLGLVGIGCGRAEREERLRWALAHAGLAERERSSYWSLSGGLKQRALVARALVRRPCLLILDEPTSSLDVSGAAAILDLLEELRERHRTAILCVAHDLEMARRYATHVALVRGGGVESGAASALLSPERLERLFRRCASDARPDPAPPDGAP
jgi:ABC-type Mn2+/Zn2+ transport system ATPase subunit